VICKKCCRCNAPLVETTQAQLYSSGLPLFSTKTIIYYILHCHNLLCLYNLINNMDIDRLAPELQTLCPPTVLSNVKEKLLPRDDCSPPNRATAALISMSMSSRQRHFSTFIRATIQSEVRSQSSLSLCLWIKP
jgi:hypothetical protein